MSIDWAVRVPASSANIGPGFDVLALALSGYAVVGVDSGTSLPRRAQPVDEHHPATVAYRALGGVNKLWTTSEIPAGRGLGFSGAMRVGGAAVAVIERSGFDGLGSAEAGREILTSVTELEQHSDNAAASLYGGLVAASGDRVSRVSLGIDFDVVVWLPDETTRSTERSRAALDNTVTRDDAVFNLGRLALLLAAFANGDVAGLRDGTQDRLHQPIRLESLPGSARAIDVALGAGADAAWLSGSGPAVAAICARRQHDAVSEALMSMRASDGYSGHVKQLRVDTDGACVIGDGEFPQS